MINSVELILGEERRQMIAKDFWTRRILTERFFNDYATPAPTSEMFDLKTNIVIQTI